MFYNCFKEDVVKGTVELKKSEKKIKNKNKGKIIIAVTITCLFLLSAAAVSAAVVSARDKANSAEEENLPVETLDIVEVQPEAVQYYVAEDQYNIDMTDLQTEIENIISNTQAVAGGDWSVYIYIPFTGDTLSMNQKKMQAASTIKLFIMGAVYENYDNLISKYDESNLNTLIKDMITISSNESADELVTMLGGGNNSKGRKIVTDYCKSLGLENTSMGRMMSDDNVVSDNYTTTEDTAKFLEMVLNGDLPHSKEMVRVMEKQERTSKIPAGIPKTVAFANKTGELEDVENDAAIIFSKYPYIICVMSDGVLDYQTPVDGITKISNTVYNYLIPKM